MVKNGCGQSGGRTLKLTVLKNEQMENLIFLHVDTDSQKLKADQKVFSFWHGQKWIW